MTRARKASLALCVALGLLGARRGVQLAFIP